ncbi:MAG TPA: site-2 protease family protein [Bacillota bacterium]
MRLAHLFGCELRLNGWFALLLAALAAAGWAAEAFILFSALLTHELAHLIVGFGFGIGFRRIELLPFGGVAETDNLYTAEPAAVALTALAGPLNNLLLLSATHLLAESRWIHPPLSDFTLRVNLALALLNLIPALPLDGGRIVHAALRRRFGDLAALRRLAVWGYVVAGGMVLAALIAAALGIALPTLPVLAFFVAVGARREQAAAVVGHLRPLWQQPERLARVGVLPAAGLVARGDVTVGTVLRHLTGGAYHFVWVVDQGLVPYGRISEARLVQAALHGDFDATLDDVLGRS